MILIETVCALAGSEQLIGPTDAERKRLQQAIATHDTPTLFGYLMEAFSYQGISDAVAFTYMDQHGRVTWGDLEQATSRPPLCPKLDNYWRFESCRFEKTNATCAQPDLMPSCPLPRHDLRNGRLNQSMHPTRTADVIVDSATCNVIGIGQAAAWLSRWRFQFQGRRSAIRLAG